ncbi:ACT domain-containing protein [Streptococcus saliviloxodontae]|nr:ACT domain-containing protein [Streptococcus saliviloxodontae]
MKINVLKQDFSVCKVSDYQQVDLTKEFVFIGKTDQENSLILPTDQVPTNTLVCEDGWRAFRIEGVLDFSLIGILAKIAGVLAQHQISIVALSTFNTDYILVKNSHLEQAVTVLSQAGYDIVM